MRKLYLLTSILLMSACWAVAQYSSSPNEQSGAAANTANTQTIQGCLSGTEGNYTLTSNAGTTYRLTGDTAKLQSQVGNTIQVTGTSSPGMNSSNNMQQSGSMSGSTEPQQTFDVTSFEHVSAHCNSM